MKPLSWIALLLLIIGLLLAPAYWVYGKFYTGQQALLLPLNAVAAPPARTPAEADPAPAAGVPTWRSAPFELHPGMAPAGLLVLAQGERSADANRPARDLYLATLYKDGVAAQPLGFSLVAEPGAQAGLEFKERLLLMQQIQPGRFQLVVQAQTPPEIRLHGLQLQVMEDIHEPNPHIVMAGIVAIILAILTWVMT